MKVLFIGVGLVHYYNRILNRLAAIDRIEIVNLVPSNSKGHVQEGVYQTKHNAHFKIVELEEYSITPIYHSFKKLSKLLKKEKPDIIVTTKFYINAFLLNFFLITPIKKLEIKLILKSIPFRGKKYHQAKWDIIHSLKKSKNLPPILSSLFKIPGIEKLIRLSLLELDRISFNLPDAHMNYVEEAYSIYNSYGVPSEKIFITCNSPDTDYLFKVRQSIEKEAPILPQCANRIIHVGRLVPWKRVDMLIRSFKKVTSDFPDAELLIIGKGPEESSLKCIVNKLKLKNQVRFLGGIYDARTLGKYFLSSSIYVIAGMGGLSINDAMCFGLPVICSVCDGTEKKLVKEGKNGSFFNDGDEDDLTRKILYLLNHPDHIRKMSYNSTEIIKNEINIHTVIKRYISAFDYVLRQK